MCVAPTERKYGTGACNPTVGCQSIITLEHSRRWFLCKTRHPQSHRPAGPRATIEPTAIPRTRQIRASPPRRKAITFQAAPPPETSTPQIREISHPHSAPSARMISLRPRSNTTARLAAWMMIQLPLPILFPAWETSTERYRVISLS
jgi:hypothetical protein